MTTQGLYVAGPAAEAVTVVPDGPEGILAEQVLRAAAEAPPSVLPGLVGVLSYAQAIAFARLAAGTREDRPEADDQLLTMKQVAEWLNIPEESARELGRRGELPTIRVGVKNIRVRPEDLRQYAALHRLPVEPGVSSSTRGRDRGLGARRSSGPLALAAATPPRRDGR
jgi:excisionase family DNA binding protein